MVIMELKSPVNNPAFDGRKRSGWQSCREFGKGVRFALTGDAGGLHVRFIDTQDVAEDSRLVTALLAASSPSSARSFKELAVTLPDGSTAEGVLDALMRTGKIDETDIRAASVAPA